MCQHNPTNSAGQTMLRVGRTNYDRMSERSEYSQNVLVCTDPQPIITRVGTLNWGSVCKSSRRRCPVRVGHVVVRCETANVNTVPNLTVCKSPKFPDVKPKMCNAKCRNPEGPTRLELPKCEERIQGRREVVLLPQRRGEALELLI